MEFDIRMFKLVTGELIIGNYDADTDSVNYVCSLQRGGAEAQKVKLLMLPYGIPFENSFGGSIEGRHFLYRFQETPEEMQKKYLEVVENILKTGSIATLHFSNIDQ